MIASNSTRQVTASSAAAAPSDMKPVKQSRTRPSASAIEHASSLRDMLRNVAGQAGELVRSLKRQKRQAKIVATTLASLKQLEKAAG